MLLDKALNELVATIIVRKVVNVSRKMENRDEYLTAIKNFLDRENIKYEITETDLGTIIKKC